jgi:O-antigen ligase
LTDNKYQAGATEPSSLTPEEIVDQYGKIRSAALQSWITMLVVCGLGVAFVGAPIVFIVLAALHTAGLPFVLLYVRRSREKQLDRVKNPFQNPPRTSGGGGSARMRRPRSAQ